MWTADHLSQQIVRDLHWIFTTPSIIQPSPLSFQAKTLDISWLEALDNSPGKINRFMSDKNLKMLGPYFEALWEFYFLNYPGKRLIAKNVQVFSANQTIGEFDFIYFDEESNQYRHLEVAIKYFLGFCDVKAGESAKEKNNSEFSPMEKWIGPNANDRLDKKYFKMLNQQSQLSQTVEGKAALEKFGISNIKPEICLLGYLFYPLQQEGRDKPIPPAQNSATDHNRAYWLKVSQLEIRLPHHEHWKIIDKPHWMASIFCVSQNLCSRNEIINKIKSRFSQYQRPLLISNFCRCEVSREEDYLSDRKYFVVPDSWPDKTF